MGKPDEIVIPADLLLSDDLAPTDGSMFDVGEFVDEGGVKEDEKVKRMVTGAGPLINLLLDWLNNDIASADSVDRLQLESKVPMEAQVLAAKQNKADSMVKKQTLLALADAHGVKYSKKKAMKFMVEQ